LRPAGSLDPASWKRELREELRHIFSGSTYQPILEQCTAIHQQVLKGRVFVALHMHAGDGNVHTNIPVNSDNYEMLQQAYRAVIASCNWRRTWAA